MEDEKKLNMKVTFSTPLQSTQPKSPSWPSGSMTLKPVLRTLMPRETSPDASEPIPSTTAAAAHDILALNDTFPLSFDTIGDMPSTYTINTDPSVPPVQHA